MKTVIRLSDRCVKNLKYLPREILEVFHSWQLMTEKCGHHKMASIKGYRVHNLQGKLKGFKSARLNREYRVIYQLDIIESMEVVFIEDVNNHYND